MNIPFSITNGAISVYVDGRMRTVPRSNVNFDALAVALRQPTHDLDEIKALVNLDSFVARMTFGLLQVSDNQVRYQGKAMHGVMVDRLLTMLSQGFDVTPLANFMNRVMQNPTDTAKDEIFLWLESGNNPFTPDGCFLAFKAVRPDYKDKYTGTMDNSVGKVVQMRREDCDPDRNNECSRGLHFCSQGYLRSFAFSDDKIMVVKVDPADVVAIPRDYNHQKGRAWRYEVVGEIPSQEVAATFFNESVINDDYQANVVGNKPMSEPVAVVEESVREKTIADTLLGGVADAEDSAGSLNKAISNQVQSVTSTITPASKASTTVIKNAFRTSDGRTFSEQEVLNALKQAGSTRGAARMLDIAKSTIQGWLKKLGA